MTKAKLFSQANCIYTHTGKLLLSVVVLVANITCYSHTFNEYLNAQEWKRTLIINTQHDQDGNQIRSWHKDKHTAQCGWMCVSLWFWYLINGIRSISRRCAYVCGVWCTAQCSVQKYTIIMFMSVAAASQCCVICVAIYNIVQNCFASWVKAKILLRLGAGSCPSTVRSFGVPKYMSMFFLLKHCI